MYSPPGVFIDDLPFLSVALSEQMCKRKHNDLLRVVRNAEKVGNIQRMPSTDWMLKSFKYLPLQ